MGCGNLKVLMRFSQSLLFLLITQEDNLVHRVLSY